MQLRVIQSNTIHGVTQLLEVIECENPFLVGKKIIHQAIKKDRYIGFISGRGKKEEASRSWDEFRTKYNLKNEIEYERH